MQLNVEGIIAIITALAGGIARIIQLTRRTKKLKNEKEAIEQANKLIIRSERTKRTNI